MNRAAFEQIRHVHPCTVNNLSPVALLFPYGPVPLDTGLTAAEDAFLMHLMTRT